MDCNFFMPLQVNSSVLTGRNASHKNRSVTDGMTVRMDLMKRAVQCRARAAIIAVTTTPAVCRRPSCVTERGTVLMDQMKETVVGE